MKPRYSLALTSICFLFQLQNSYSQEIKLSVFKPQGGGVSWSPDGKRICYDMKGPGKEQYYEIHTANPDGALDTCISCQNKDLPHKETGSPNYHPSGKYIIFVSEKAVHKGSHFTAIPGFGGYSDIWVMTPDGKKAWKLLETRNDKNDGIIAPKFSHDGKKIVWVERTKYPHPFRKKQFLGLWIIKTADFVVDSSGAPSLKNIGGFQYGGDAFFETYGFSPDDKKIIFCSNYNVRYWFQCGIYTIDLVSGHITQLTSTDYNEHATYSPDGKHILWMTNSCATKQGTDWWIMDTNGANKQRLTYFNEPSNPMYNGHKKWACYGSFSPDGKSFVGGAQTSLFKQEGLIYRVDFLPCDSGNGLIGRYEKGWDSNYIRYDPAINFRWGPYLSDSMIISPNYSLYWNGYVKPLYSETYVIYVPGDNKMSVTIDGTEIIKPSMKRNNMNEKAATIQLVAGKKYRLEVSLYNHEKKKVDVFLEWSSEHQYKQAIPCSQLFRLP